MKIYDVAIIGAGPAGIMAALSASHSGKRVILVEKNDFIGRKIFATGNGRCNITNNNISLDRYHGASRDFIQNIFDQYNQNTTIQFFESLGIVLKEEDRGRIFPRTNQASTVVEALNHALIENNVYIKKSSLVKNIAKKEDFVIEIENDETIYAKNVVITTGGKASFQFGSSGDGIFWAKRFGHNIIPIFAALVPLETEETWVKDVQGIKVEAKVTSKLNNEVLKETEGDLLFTHFGISGPAVMAQAGTISPLVEEHKLEILIDLYPELSEQELDQKLENIFKVNNKKSARNALLGLFPAGLVPIVLKDSNTSADKNASEISRADRLAIAKTIKGLKLTVKKVRPLKEAQVSRGGVDTSEVKSTLESKLVPGLYFAGEVLDVDADSGGFNLQWAWSSGYVAGKL